MWASEIIASEGWVDVVWSSDATNIIKEINLSTDLVLWSTRLGVLHIKDRCLKFNWIFNWNCIASNRAADRVAKLFLVNNCCSYFDFSSVEAFPSEFSNVLTKDFGRPVV